MSDRTFCILTFLFALMVLVYRLGEAAGAAFFRLDAGLPVTMDIAAFLVTVPFAIVALRALYVASRTDAVSGNGETSS